MRELKLSVEKPGIDQNAGLLVLSFEYSRRESTMMSGSAAGKRLEVLIHLDPQVPPVLVGDPLYATYEGLIAATGAVAVPVPCLVSPALQVDGVWTTPPKVLEPVPSASR